MATVWVGALAALGGALIGASVTIVQLVFNHRREWKKQHDSLLITALTFLTGDENQRSCGISMVEGVFSEKKEYARILVPALTSQAVYLLLHTESHASRTEFYNWLRIMEVLESLFATFQITGDYYGEIGNAFLIKVEPNYIGGLDMSRSTLNIWAKKYGIDFDADVEIDD
jgi:hypothetical protein